MTKYFKHFITQIHKYPSTLYWLCFYLIVDRNYLEGFINEIPFHTHEWAQADRCSIAQAFYHYGSPIWDPSTLNLASFQGKVGVELPLIAYIAGFIGKYYGPEYIYSSFRFFNLLICGMGGWFLFKLVYKQTKTVAGQMYI